MKLPNGERAYLDPKKLTGYLLSLTHPVGGSKARFFRELGFDERSVGDLERALLEIARAGEVTETVASERGTKYVVDGALKTRIGSAVLVRTVWVTEAGQDFPRFVTAYPV